MSGASTKTVDVVPGIAAWNENGPPGFVERQTAYPVTP